MAHTTTIGGYVFIRDDRFDGEVVIIDNTGIGRVTVPMAVLVDFVGGAVRDRLIAGLEQAAGADVFNLLLKPLGGRTPMFTPPRKGG